MSAARVEPELAIRELTAGLAEDPGLLMARRTRAVAYAACGRHDLAIADLRLLESQKQLTPEDAVVLGDNLRFTGRLADAAAVLERAARENQTWKCFHNRRSGGQEKYFKRPRLLIFLSPVKSSSDWDAHR